jgi:hypothetical protein
MKILVACEYSGVVRDAFSARGWDAWSCDLEPTESELTKKEGKHIQDNVLAHLNEGWDLLIGHPPCTYLSYAGNRSWNIRGRVFDRLLALEFFAKLWDADIPYICLENPKSCASPVIAKYTQQIQPFWFGEPYIKTTWLWLKNLPPLHQTNFMLPEYAWVNGGSKKTRKHVGLKNNFKDRARTFNGIANAMAEQWTEYLEASVKNDRLRIDRV